MNFKVQNIFIAISIFVSLFLTACDNSQVAGSKTDASTAPGPVFSSKAVINDSNGTFIGNLIDISDEDITIITSNNYLMRINMDGSMDSKAIFYTGIDGTGTLYAELDDPAMYYYRMVRYNFLTDTYYTNKKEFNDDNTPALSRDVPVMSYYYPETEAPGNYHNDTWTLDYAVELKSTTRSEIGLPATIVLPLVFI